MSLRDDVDAKALHDLLRIAATTSGLQRVYFCSSHKLTEHRITTLEGQLSAEVDHAFPITCLGATQLTEAISHAPEILERYYGAEIRNALRAIETEPSDETELHGLRLALVAAAGEDSVQIRRELYKGVVLEVLGDGRPRTIGVCAKEISERLRLGRSISEAAVQPHIARLVDAGLIEPRQSTFAITDAGRALGGTLRAEAAERFISGRAAIRKALEDSIGERIGEDDFGNIWRIFEERIAANFHARGASLVSEVSALLEEISPEEPRESSSQLSFVEELATAIAHTSTHPQRRAELRQATIDLFTDRTSGAADWLVRVCASFVACCALGLEYSSGAALTKLLARTSLILDSDVVLSLLGEGEPEHQSVFTIVSRWIHTGGKVLVAEPVLEEVAYHAHIAPRDYEQVRHLLPGTAEDRLRIIDNAFVRSFAELLAQGNASPKHWNRFIRQFSGRQPYDWTTVLAHLSAEFSIAKLPPKSSELDKLEREVRAFLIKAAEKGGYSGKTVSDKASRDARLYTEMVHYLRSVRATDPGATCLLVSSAHRLARAEDAFHEAGEQQFVVPISVVLQLLSLLPQVSLGLSALKTFLFEERRPGFSSELERTILRLVRTSQEVSMPWAKRGMLMREVRDRLIDDARKQGTRMSTEGNTAQLERAALSPENMDRTIQVLGDALDKVAVRTRAEDEMLRLRTENEALRRQLEAARARTHRRN